MAKKKAKCNCRHTVGMDPACSIHGDPKRMEQHKETIRREGIHHNPHYCDVCRGGSDQLGFSSSLDW